MKLAPVSADLLIKLSLGAVVVLGVLYAVNKAAAAAGQVATGAVNAAGQALYAVSPTNNENVLYQTANTLTGGTADRPLGVRIYDFFHPDQ